MESFLISTTAENVMFSHGRITVNEGLIKMFNVSSEQKTELFALSASLDHLVEVYFKKMHIFFLQVDEVRDQVCSVVCVW